MMRSDGEEAEGSLPRCCDGGGAARDAGTPMPGKQCGLTWSRLFFRTLSWLIRFLQWLRNIHVSS